MSKSDFLWAYVHFLYLFLSMGVCQGVSTNSLKFYSGLPCPTLLRSADGPPLKRPYGGFWVVSAAVFYRNGHLTPYAYDSLPFFALFLYPFLGAIILLYTKKALPSIVTVFKTSYRCIFESLCGPRSKTTNCWMPFTF
jgi:hypothetical protein